MKRSKISSSKSLLEQLKSREDNVKRPKKIDFFKSPNFWCYP